MVITKIKEYPTNDSRVFLQIEWLEHRLEHRLKEFSNLV